MLKRISAVLAAATLAVLLATASSARQSTRKVQTNSTDRMFVTTLAHGNTAEIRLSKLALRKASKKKVNGFAAHMVRDHTAAGVSLGHIAKQDRLYAPMTLDAHHAAIYRRLSRLSGSAFDRGYMNAMLDDHAKTVSLFLHEIAYGKNPDVKNFATKTVGTIQNHLQMAQEVTGKTGAPSHIKNPPTAHSGMKM